MSRNGVSRSGVIKARILGTGAALPKRVVHTRELLDTLLPHRDPVELGARIGIHTRHWLGEGESAASLATAAVREALEEAGLPATALGRVVLCTSTGGDQMIPATATDVAERLGLDDHCDAFDVTNSCVGFLTGLDLAASHACTHGEVVAVVAVETFSRDLSPRDPRAMLVLGDAAAAAVVGPSDDGGIVARHLRWSSRLFRRMVMPTPRTGAERTWHGFGASTGDLTTSAVECIGGAADAVLRRAGVGWAAVQHVLPHQPNGEMLACLLATLPVRADQLTPVVERVGSIGAASVAYSLHAARRRSPMRPGGLALLASVGSGTSYGALLWRWPDAGPPPSP